MTIKNYIKIFIPIFALILCGIVVFLERVGVSKDLAKTFEYSTGNLEYSAKIEGDKECLLFSYKDDITNNAHLENMKMILTDMKIGYDVYELTSKEPFPDMNNYRTAVITFEDWDIFSENIFGLCQWVKEGGNLMNACTPAPGKVYGIVCNKFGVASAGTEYVSVDGLKFVNDFMIGANKGDFFDLSESGESLDVTLNAVLQDTAEVFITAGDGKTPILWRNKYGEGCFVFLNDSLVDRFQRGFLCSAYSLMDSSCIYSVINGSAYYIDDLPSPFPEGTNEYIYRDYGISNTEFFSSVWWPDIIEWENRFGIKHTGLIIELYNDTMKAPFETNNNTSDYITIGNMLLNNGGELGLHGYNHQPLIFKGINDDMQFGYYKMWENEDDMRGALTELYNFASELYKSEKFSVYVPPSNIISLEGEKILKETCPDIRIVAASYLPDSDVKACIQEFCIDDAGLINTPRVTSGCLFDYYNKVTALSELNFHYVQSHFTHPDDCLDVDRGAKVGWERLKLNFEEYCSWILNTAPDLRNMTGSELGTAVEQFCNVSVNREYMDNGIKVRLGGFSNEAYFLMRVNDGDITNATGCDYTKVGYDLYLIHATDDELFIEY